jgi:cytochrome c oxidase subunit 4
MDPAPAAAEGAAATHGGGAAPGRRPRREYWSVFASLVVLTALELGVIRMPGVGRWPTIVALLGLAVSKAALIVLFFMHLKDETRVLRLTVLGPLAAPAVYALALMADSTWRLLR